MTGELQRNLSSERSTLTTFMLVRHGEKIRGLKDLGLTRAGIEQVSDLGETLLRWRPRSIFSSTYPRTRHTASIIAEINKMEVRRCEALVERRVAPPPGCDSSGFKAEWAKADASRDYSSFGGESSRLAGKRFGVCLENLAYSTSDRRILVVSHGGIIRDFLLNVVDNDPACTHLLPDPFPAHLVPLASATEVTFRRGVFVINFFALTGARLRKELSRDAR